jgi:hypothetical protein
MALALAAVFGSISLANPAMASVGQSADAELTEREFQPQKAVTLKTTPGEGTVSLSWREPGGLPADTTWSARFREDVTGSSFTEVATGTLSPSCTTGSCTATISAGVTDKVTYLFQVIGTGGSPVARQAISALVPATPNNAPAAGPTPDAVIAQTEDGDNIGGALEVSWTEITSDEPDMWQYRVRVDPDRTPDNADDETGDWMTMTGVEGDGTEYVITGLESLRTRVMIRGVNVYSTGNVVGTTGTDDVDVTPIPAKPSGFSAKAGNGEVNLSWDDPENRGIAYWNYRYKSGDDDYGSWTFVSYNDSGNTPPTTTPVTEATAADPGATKVTVDDLNNGTEYTFQVLAGTGDLGGQEYGEASDAMMATPVMPTPTTLKEGGIPDPAMLGRGARITLDLNDYYNAGDGEGAIDQFEVIVAGTSATVTGLVQDGDKKVTKSGMIAVVGLMDGITVVTVIADDMYDGTDDPEVASFTVTVGAPAAEVPPVPDLNPSLTALSNDPGKTTRYTIMFKANGDVHAGSDELVIELEDFGFPSSVDANDVTIRVHSMHYNEPSDPESVTVSGEKLRIVLGDTNPDTDSVEGISMGDNVTVTIGQNAKLSNPTEGKDSYMAVITGGGLKEITTAAFSVPLIIELGEEDGGRGDTLTLIAKGFKNGHTLTFWLDRNMDNVPGDLGESTLCSATVSGDDTATCDFEVNNPPFKSGEGTCSGTDPDCNFVNAFDGAGNMGSAIAGRGAAAKVADSGLVEDQTFELKAGISINPETGSVGDSIQVEMTDFPANANVTNVSIAGITVPNVSGSVNSSGNGSFSFTIPNRVPQGIEKLVVEAGGADADTKLIVGGPSIRVTPGTVLANQRINVVATGFTANARICCVDPDGAGTDHRMPEVKLGNVIIPVGRINDGATVSVDDGGTWAASINLPLVKALTEEGTKELQVTDSKGRVGRVDVTIPARTIEVTPESGRVGTWAVVSGANFPSVNDEGDSFSVSIVYKASTGSTTTVSATPDASGRFTEQVRIPTGAAIPSTNNILVSFTAGGQEVTTSITHEVPEGIITLSETSGAPGSVVTVTGEGFKSIVSVASAKVGDVDVIPLPRPTTSQQGMVSFDITIPGLSEGIHTVEVIIGKTTASVGFTITQGLAIGAAALIADGLDALGDNVEAVWYFDNTTKVWSFYSPGLEEGNTLTYLIAGETYLIQVKANADVILNHKSRNLTCVGDNCWNQIVW